MELTGNKQQDKSIFTLKPEEIFEAVIRYLLTKYEIPDCKAHMIVSVDVTPDGEKETTMKIEMPVGLNEIHEKEETP